MKKVLEIKNIAVLPECQHKGYGKRLIHYIEQKYGKDFRIGMVDSPLTIPFYEKCGFVKIYRLRNFFTDNYDHPVFECGIQLIDMVYLEKSVHRKPGLCGRCNFQ